MTPKDIAKIIRKAGEKPTFAQMKEHEKLIKDFALDIVENLQKEVYLPWEPFKGNSFDNAKRKLK